LLGKINQLVAIKKWLLDETIRVLSGKNRLLKA
jgi:hypothetical protein